jgi:ANTAR domain
LRAVLSVPVELARGPVGTLEVYGAGPRDWNDSEVAALGAYAGLVASVLPAAATATAKGELAEQLQWALGHRVLVEQAKGVLMEREGLSPAAAFARLRTTARTVGRTVGEAAGVVLLVVACPPSGAQPEGQGRSEVAVAAAAGYRRALAGLVVALARLGRRGANLPPGRP